MYTTTSSTYVHPSLLSHHNIASPLFSQVTANSTISPPTFTGYEGAWHRMVMLCLSSRCGAKRMARVYILVDSYFKLVNSSKSPSRDNFSFVIKSTKHHQRPPQTIINLHTSICTARHRWVACDCIFIVLRLKSRSLIFNPMLGHFASHLVLIPIAM